MDELVAIVARCEWFVGVLRVVRDAGLPDAWVGAGALRDLVWGERYGSGFRPAEVRDVDVAFFDAADLSRQRDRTATELLAAREPAVPWEATNQAAVHTWYHEVFPGDPVEPLVSTADGIATWPETATAVAVRLDAGDRLRVCAPLGVDDLLNGVWRPNARRVGVEQARTRLARLRPGARWPGVRVIGPGD
ncbi:nucleotidyltransferase family protein [Actinoplanes sp. CA-030573]|uniref:nucleotidyltransferase family protein n=1 Tax=Actinoplanes sp. CA-030573 TaxID=3239898 RepID=UPI003D92F192